MQFMGKLYIFCGIPFAGKTMLASKTAQLLGYTRIDLDEIKFQIIGRDVKDEAIDQKGWDRIYQEMYRQIQEALKQGKTVVHDAGNFTAYERGLVRKIADDLGIESTTVFVDTPMMQENDCTKTTNQTFVSISTMKASILQLRKWNHPKRTKNISFTMGQNRWMNGSRRI